MNPPLPSAATPLPSPRPLRVTTQADRTALALSDNLAVTLTIEGPAPLRVEPPQPSWLTEDSAAIWTARVLHPPVIESLAEGQERWSVTLRLSPFVPGEALPVQFSSARVTVGGEASPRTVSWDGMEVRVYTSVDGTVAEPRPITGWEPMPSVISPVSEPAPTDRYLASFALLALALLMLAIAAGVRKRRRSPVDPAQAALMELDRLDASMEPRRLADRLARLVRMFLQRRYQVPATRLTSDELDRVLAGVPQAEGWRRLLQVCERRFAPEALHLSECHQLHQAIRQRLEEDLHDRQAARQP